MELPFLKNKNRQGGSGPSETIHAHIDGRSNSQLLEMVTDELMEAWEKNNKGGFLHALRAFTQMVRNQDATD